MAGTGTLSSVLPKHNRVPNTWKHLPLKVMTGRAPDTPSKRLAFTGYTFKTVETNKISIQTITKHVENIRKIIHEIQNKVRRSKSIKKNKITKNARHLQQQYYMLEIMFS